MPLRKHNQNSGPKINKETANTELWAGVRNVLPFQLGVVPFGLIFGMLGISSGLTPLQTILMSSIIFGGASQVVLVQLWATVTPPIFIGASVSMINMRHILYGASVAPYLRQLPLWWRIILAYLLTDEAYAVSIKHFLEYPTNSFRHFYLLGAGMALWIFWQISTICGIILGSFIPDELGLKFAIPLTFLAVVVNELKKKDHVLVMLVSGFVSLILFDAPFRSYIILSPIIALITALLILRFRK